jgi:hypothetical protein
VEGGGVMVFDQLLDFLDNGDASGLVDDITNVLIATPPIALERATALYIWKRAWESALPASRRGGDRKSQAWRELDQSEKISFSSVAAEKLGVSERAIQIDVQLVDQLGADTVRRLWSSPIADNAQALKTVAALDESRRRSLFTVWDSKPTLKFRAVLVEARLQAERDAEEAMFRSLVATWARAGSKARRRFLSEIGLDDTAADTLVRKAQKRGAK